MGLHRSLFTLSLLKLDEQVHNPIRQVRRNTIGSFIAPEAHPRLQSCGISARCHQSGKTVLALWQITMMSAIKRPPRCSASNWTPSAHGRRRVLAQARYPHNVADGFTWRTVLRRISRCSTGGFDYDDVRSKSGW